MGKQVISKNYLLLLPRRKRKKFLEEVIFRREVKDECELEKRERQDLGTKEKQTVPGTNSGMREGPNYVLLLFNLLKLFLCG